MSVRSDLLATKESRALAAILASPTGLNALGIQTGTATLSSGTAMVVARLTASSKIFVTRNTPHGTVGDLSVPQASRAPGVSGSFSINSASGSDASTVDWMVVS